MVLKKQEKHLSFQRDNIIAIKREYALINKCIFSLLFYEFIKLIAQKL